MFRKLICKIFDHNYILINTQITAIGMLSNKTVHTYKCSRCKNTFDW